MNICAILYLDSVRLGLHEPPKLLFNVVLVHRNIAILVLPWVIWANHALWRMSGEPHATKLLISSLEAREAMLLAFVEAVVSAGAKQAGVAEPLTTRDRVQRWVEAEHVETYLPSGSARTPESKTTKFTAIATVAKQHFFATVRLIAYLTCLL